LDEGVYEGWVVPMDYDPLLGKLIVWAASRGDAISRMHRALGEYYVGGIKTNTELFLRILESLEFVRAEIHTRWLDDWLLRGASERAEAAVPPDSLLQDAAIAAALTAYLDRDSVHAKYLSAAAGAESQSQIVAGRRREVGDRVPERGRR
jgi:acetyl-CoA carboxylase biotin carboxylase subunit